MERDREVNVINNFLEENFLNKRFLFFRYGEYEANESRWPIPYVASVKTIRLAENSTIEVGWAVPDVEEILVTYYESLFKLMKHYCKHNSDTFNYTGF